MRCAPRTPRHLAVPPAILIAASLLATGGCAELRTWMGPEIPRDLTAETRPTAEIRATDHRSARALRFLVFGDAGTGEEGQRRIAAAMLDVCAERGGCSFALVTGDLIYPVGIRPSEDPEDIAAQFESAFERPYSAFGRFDFWVVAGNHDWYRRGSTRAEVAHSAHSHRWRMPSLDYRVPLLPDWIAVYGIDTTLIEAGHPIGQLERAGQALCSADGWRLLFGHHPAYSVGPHADRTGSIPEIRDALRSTLLARCEVDFYFAGHDHVQAHLSAPRFEQIVQGTGGQRLHRVRADRRFPAGVRLQRAQERFGFALAEATPRRLTLTFFDIGDDGVRPFYTIDRRREPSGRSRIAEPEG